MDKKKDPGQEIFRIILRIPTSLVEVIDKRRKLYGGYVVPRNRFLVEAISEYLDQTKGAWE